MGNGNISTLLLLTLNDTIFCNCNILYKLLCHLKVLTVGSQINVKGSPTLLIGYHKWHTLVFLLYFLKMSNRSVIYLFEKLF